MTNDLIALCTLTLTIAVHLASTLWWAASMTRRVDHIEKWISYNAHTAARLAALEQSIQHLTDSVLRVEHFLHDKK